MDSTIRSEYAYHMPSPEQLAQMTRLRQAYSDLADLLSGVEKCRYRSLAETALEESATWANKAVVLGTEGNRK